MPVFKSSLPNLSLPTSTTLYDFFFSSYASNASNTDASVAGYTNSVTGERIDFASAKAASSHISTALGRKYNFCHGDKIMLFSGNSIWYPVMMFAALRIGGIVSGASPAYGVEEMVYALKTAEARFLVMDGRDKDKLEVGLAAAKRAGIEKERVFVMETNELGREFVSVKELAELGREEKQIEEFQVPTGQTNRDICAFLCFSSGTTGMPKAVMISHANVIAQASQVQQIAPASVKRILAVLPFYHISGLIHTLHLPLLLNAEVFMLPKFSMDPMLRAITTHKIEELLVVPPLLIRLLNDSIVKNYDLSCVKRFSSGAAPVSEKIMQLLDQKYPGAGFKNGYGMTETTSCITGFPPELYDLKYASTVGQLLANTEIRIVKGDGAEARVNEHGEIWARGPQVVMGYLHNEEATRATFDLDGGGWLRTGDLGSIDERGIVTIHDRIKEMIKVKGIAVAPAELEDLLLGHGMIQDVAVIGVPDDYSGELPKAFVVLKQGIEGDADTRQELIEYVQENKTKPKWVAEVEFVEEIPKSASGKILRKTLRDKEKAARKG